jgi:polyferredoxin
MNYPRGLIRNSTQNGIEQKLPRAAMFRRVLRPRIIIYTSVLVLVSAGLLWSLLSRASFRVDVVRDRGSIGRMVGQGQIENVYRLQIMNAIEHEQRYVLGVAGIAGARIVSEHDVVLEAASSRWVPVRVQVPPDAAGPGSHPMTFSIKTQNSSPEEVTEKSVFLVPK